MNLNWKKEEVKIEQSEFLTKKRKYNQIVPYEGNIYGSSNKVEYNAKTAKNNIVEKNDLDNEKPKKASRNVPLLLYVYSYSIFNICIFCIFLYISFCAVLLIKSEITSKIRVRRKVIEKIIERARYNYNINKCEPNQRVPALQNLCNKWECEMSRGLESVEIFKIVGEVFGDVIDAFISRFSMKSIICSLSFFTVYLFLRNRNK
ncbi:hypothetical protein BDAP_001991 [Binucleata daphniae]